MTPARKEELEKKVTDLFRCESFGYAVSKADVLELLEEVEREVWEKGAQHCERLADLSRIDDRLAQQDAYENVSGWCRQHAEAAR